MSEVAEKQPMAYELEVTNCKQLRKDTDDIIQRVKEQPQSGKIV